jgi:hypothetical protein
MTTTLRNFQNEIDEIHSREITKQRASATTAAEKEAKKTTKPKDAKDMKEKPAVEEMEEAPRIDDASGELQVLYLPH